MAVFVPKVWNIFLMGRCQRAGTSKNKKVTENFLPASIIALGLRGENSLKNHIFYQK
jgi:hypothetical protein